MKTAMNRARIMKALIIEDNPYMLDLLALQLELMGFGIISANNGKEGVEKAIKEKPCLIFMDIMMPGMDGREATRKIRSNPETQYIPIIVATALFRDSDLRSCVEAGCNDYLVKPFTMKQLLGKIKEFIPPSNVMCTSKNNIRTAGKVAGMLFERQAFLSEFRARGELRACPFSTDF